MNFKTFRELADYMRRLGFGRIEDIIIQCAADDLDLREALASRSVPLRNFALLLQDGQEHHFLVLKVQNGLPIHGESEFIHEGRAAIRSHKFG